MGIIMELSIPWYSQQDYSDTLKSMCFLAYFGCPHFFLADQLIINWMSKKSPEFILRLRMFLADPKDPTCCYWRCDSAEFRGKRAELEAAEVHRLEAARRAAARFRRERCAELKAKAVPRQISPGENAGKYGGFCLFFIGFRTLGKRWKNAGDLILTGKDGGKMLSLAMENG